jgi:hypothetical protein
MQVPYDSSRGQSPCTRESFLSWDLQCPCYDLPWPVFQGKVILEPVEQPSIDPIGGGMIGHVSPLPG